MAVGGCATTPTSQISPTHTGSACSTASATIAFDFETAPQSTCAILGERKFAVLVSPEHASPINPSPWYAFRYVTKGTEGISVRLDYVGARHRYSPKLIHGETATSLPVEVNGDGSSARLHLPPGEGLVAAQELFASKRYRLFIDRLAGLPRAEKIELGRSLDGRPITAARFGDPAAPRLVVLIGRQHPPEVTGAIAMEAFVDELARLVQADGSAGRNFQFLVIPEINPDGVARGHWRANRGSKDLNRDWGEFSQPETRAVKVWLDALPPGIRPVAMLDFHSTNRNLFYVQSETETDEREELFLVGWLEGKQATMAGYPFLIQRKNANPGLGTAKNWFHEAYDIPSYTYEVGDDSAREDITRSAILLARPFFDQLDVLMAGGRS